MINQPSRLFRYALLALSLMLPIASYAQMDEARAEQFREQMKQTEARLQLTDEQKEQIGPILRESAEQKLEILQSFGFSKDGERPDLSFRQKRELGKKIRAVDDTTNEKLSKILNDKQMDEFKKIQEENREKRREQFKNRS